MSIDLGLVLFYVLAPDNKNNMLLNHTVYKCEGIGQVMVCHRNWKSDATKRSYEILSYDVHLFIYPIDFGERNGGWRQEDGAECSEHKINNDHISVVKSSRPLIIFETWLSG